MSIRKPIPGTYEAALLRSFVTVMELSHSLGEYVSELAAASIAARGEFNVAISGGSALEFLNTGLHDVAETGLAIGMQNWHVFYVDERCVPFDSEQSNHHNASILYDKPWCPTPADHIHPVNPTLPPDAMAADYQAKIQAHFKTSGIPSFDLIILGMGPDGHTASLFPGHPLLEESTKLVAAVLDSPKPPAARVTFTYPLINAANAIAFVTAGGEKAAAFSKIHHTVTPPDATLPCVRVHTKSGAPCVWFVDREITRAMEDEIDRSGTAPFAPRSAAK